MFEANQFLLRPYSSALANTTVLNVNQLEYHTWLEIPHDVFHMYSLYEVAVVSDDGTPVDFVGRIQQDADHPWLRVDTSALNVNAGFHMYRFQFVNTQTHDIISLFFSYRIQDDHPDKSSYVYMQREED